MTVIPVIDLLQGRAVLAQRGQRRHYQPVNSPLCEQGDVLPLVERLTTRFRFNILYIADLDAIQGNGDNTALIDTLSAHHRDLQIWLDAGFDGPDALRRMSTACRCRPVVGSETWQHSDPLPDHRCLLSIDLDRHGLRDPSGIAADPSRYPRDVVLMNLDRVGADQGPDLALLDVHSRRTSPHTRLYLAGGIRDSADIHAAHAAGAAGVLLASAIHSGRVTPADLAAFS